MGMRLRIKSAMTRLEYLNLHVFISTTRLMIAQPKAAPCGHNQIKLTHKVLPPTPPAYITITRGDKYGHLSNNSRWHIGGGA